MRDLLLRMMFAVAVCGLVPSCAIAAGDGDVTFSVQVTKEANLSELSDSLRKRIGEPASSDTVSSSFKVKVPGKEAHDMEKQLKAAFGDSNVEEVHEGVPLSFHGDLAIWSLIVFILFVIVLKTFAWGPLSAGLDKREAGIRENIADAERARVKAEQMLAEHAEKLDLVQDEVREIIAEARRDAEHTKRDILETAQNEANATKERSIAEIERARDQALKELFDTLSAQVAVATEYVLGRSITDDDQQRLIDEAISQFSET